MTYNMAEARLTSLAQTPVLIDWSYIYRALFSASKQTCCALVTCNWMSDCSVKSSVWFGSYMGDAMWNTWLSCLGTHSAYTMHQWTVLFKATHACGACVFSCNLTPALLSESPGFLCATAKTQGWTGHRKKESAQNVDWGEEMSPTAHAGSIKPMTFWLRVQVSTTEL